MQISRISNVSNTNFGMSIKRDMSKYPNSDGLPSELSEVINNLTPKERTTAKKYISLLDSSTPNHEVSFDFVDNAGYVSALPTKSLRINRAEPFPYRPFTTSDKKFMDLFTVLDDLKLGYSLNNALQNLYNSIQYDDLSAKGATKLYNIIKKLPNNGSEAWTRVGHPSIGGYDSNLLGDVYADNTDKKLIQAARLINELDNNRKYKFGYGYYNHAGKNGEFVVKAEPVERNKGLQPIETSSSCSPTIALQKMQKALAKPKAKK